MSYCAVAAALNRSEDYLDRFLSHMPSILEPGGLDDYACGRAGILYLFRLMKHFFPTSALKIDPWIPKTVEAILSNGPPWLFMGLDIISPSHGRIGIVTQILLTDPSYAPRLVDEIDKVLNWQMSNGNWPNTVPGSSYHKDYLVQWCHGGTGVMHSLAVLRPHLNAFPSTQTRIDLATEKAQKLVWEKGLLRKDPCLCHGITGNALAGFDPGEQRDHFLAHTTEKTYEKLENEGKWEHNADYGKPFSVLTGWVGKAVGWMYRDRARDESVFAYCDV